MVGSCGLLNLFGGTKGIQFSLERPPGPLAESLWPTPFSQPVIFQDVLNLSTTPDHEVTDKTSGRIFNRQSQKDTTPDNVPAQCTKKKTLLIDYLKHTN
ncbi:hypothetical protein I79_004669 [Cricetulus griseus]|uniref:Uncharacterized protein n=1 Tax=Cricetulus griseus TaxID=10029 RepID=G3H358_CRIGR|nr:hypothetical protein I79_004669 [Cricetulus griseus]